ncbi:MAG TPA: hypothetical protein VK468_00325, partial [Pyrinomonadaceae bacterium]|nr:hypothetical protein [Pyrinomonadaceae bacterium]
MKHEGRKRVLFFIIAGVAAISGVYLFLGARPQSAQQQTVPKGDRFAKFAVSDSITHDIRDRSRELVRVDIRSLDDRRKAAKLGRIVEDLGSSVVVSKEKNAKAARLSARVISKTISAPGYKFDPIADARIETVSANASTPPDAGYYIVQFGGIA